MLHTKPQGHWPFGSREEHFCIWAWRPSWSCDPDPANELLFPHATEAPFGFDRPSGFGEEDL